MLWAFSYSIDFKVEYTPKLCKKKQQRRNKKYKKWKQSEIEEKKNLRHSQMVLSCVYKNSRKIVKSQEKGAREMETMNMRPRLTSTQLEILVRWKST